MTYIELKNELNSFSVFSLKDIKAIDPNFHRSRLNDWQKKGYLQKIIRGYYVFSDTQITDKILFKIANKIYSPSYVSLETALSYYGFIPEAVYAITSVSTKKTTSFNTFAANFMYRSIAKHIFFGYDLIADNNRCFRMAKPEKAILDFLYLHPDLEKADDFSSLRINIEIFLKKVKKDIFFNYMDAFKQKKLKKRAMKFWEYINHA
ncbi:MAG: hypothetical protein ABH857_04800 [Elusimicrobiota bacterium]